jgi:hypothetical protein
MQIYSAVDIEVPQLTRTCNLIQDVNYYNKLEEPTDEENDMLDLAFGLTET